MPTPEEIKKIARDLTRLLVHPDDYTPNREQVYRQTEAMMTLLSKDYCIVPKSKVREECDFWRQRLPKNCNLASEVNNNPDTARMWGKIEVLEDIFGTELFNEESQVPQEK